jgi:hypothetical protein
MALSQEHLEAIVWPRYKDAAAELCQALWALANPKQALVKSPGWFNEIVEIQVKSVLMLVFSTPQAWVVLPEPVPGYTVVLFKKQRVANIQTQQQKLILRGHGFDQFNELARLVEKAMAKLLKKAVQSGSGDVVELENEDGHIFCFPRSKMETYLRALGFSDEQIPKLLSIEDIESGA